MNTKPTPLASKFQYQLILPFPNEIKRKIWVEEDVAQFIKDLKEELPYILDGRCHCVDCKGHAKQELNEIIDKLAGDFEK